MPPHLITQSERRAGRLFALCVFMLFLTLAILHAL
jgi:hypothetical protein